MQKKSEATVAAKHQIANLSTKPYLKAMSPDNSVLFPSPGYLEYFLWILPLLNKTWTNSICYQLCQWSDTADSGYGADELCNIITNNKYGDKKSHFDFWPVPAGNFWTIPVTKAPATVYANGQMQLTKDREQINKTLA